MSRFSYHLPILGYHRVGLLRDPHVPTVSAELFERHLQFLARHRYQVIDLEAVATLLDRGQRWPRRHVVITFDDGYEETATIAWPLLKRFGFPATVFVTPAEVGRPGFMTWAQIADVAKDGMTIGNHTMYHSYLPVVKPEQLQEELVESKRCIEAQVGHPVRFMSYPVGGFTPQVQGLLRQVGYRAACTTNRAATINGIDRFALRRVKMTERDRYPWLLWAKVSGYYDCFRRLHEPS